MEDDDAASAPDAKLMSSTKADARGRVLGCMYALRAGSCEMHPQWKGRGRKLLQAATIFAFAYLCSGEFLPQPLTSASTFFFRTDWATQEFVLLATLACLTVLLAYAGGCSGSGFEPAAGGRPSTASSLLAALNIIPIVFVVATTIWVSRSDNCPAYTPDDTENGQEVDCDYPATLLDVVGLISARLARFDLGLSLILATRGDSGWLLRATGGWLGLPEAVPLHRIAGWWCVGQSALHSVAYLFFYPWTGGLKSLWLNCFPTALPDKSLNSLGLVNFFGVVAFAAMLPLAIPSLPNLRRRGYHIFQQLHLPAAVLFVICCAMHDLPILIFAVPGIADWYLGWQSTRRAATTHSATARLLSGTSGPWVELTVECSGLGSAALLPSVSTQHARRPVAPRGEWALVRVVPLGKEAHPLSVAVSSSGPRLSALVAAGAGNWSTSLASLVQSIGTDEVQVEVTGPFAVGGGDWSLVREPALLLVAGGSGVFGWLPALASADASAGAGRLVHLVWCVKTEADYQALATKLPWRRAGVQLTIFVTQASGSSLTVGDHTAAALSIDGATSQDEHHEEGKSNTALLGGFGDDVRERELAAVRTGGVGGSSEDGSDSSSLVRASVSLFATFCALAVGYWGWQFVKEDLLETSTTLMDYTLCWRTLPIALILASLVVATTAASRIFEGASKEEKDDSAAAAVNGPAEGERAEYEGISLLELGAGDAVGDHDVRAGRPNLAVLVRTAAAAAAAGGRRRDPAQRLVVAACGPAELVEAARNAVGCVRKEGCRVRLYFSGTDSRW